MELFKGQRDALWAELARQASAQIQPQFAGEMAALTFDILDRAIEEELADLVEVCGNTGRHILAARNLIRASVPERVAILLPSGVMGSAKFSDTTRLTWRAIADFSRLVCLS